MTEAAKFELSGKEFDYPVLSGSVGPDVVDIRKLYGQTGAFTYDPGFTSTASCRSALTYIDGDEGVLLHRGYPIGELAEKFDIDAVAVTSSRVRALERGLAISESIFSVGAIAWQYGQSLRKKKISPCSLANIFSCCSSF